MSQGKGGGLGGGHRGLDLTGIIQKSMKNRMDFETPWQP